MILSEIFLNLFLVIKQKCQSNQMVSMRKLILLAGALMICIGLDAQVLRTSSQEFVVKAGGGFTNFWGSGTKGCEAYPGAIVMFSYQKPIGSLGAHWGQGLAVATRGWKSKKLAGSDYRKAIACDVQLYPAIFGWDLRFGRSFMVEPHAGVYGSYDVYSNLKDSQYNIDETWDDFAKSTTDLSYTKFDLGAQAGVSFWFKQFTIDASYQSGFVNAFDKAGDFKHMGLMVSLGIAF